jgi:hydrogenase maturation protease
MKTLVIGYGNPLRSDDGIGPYVVDQIAKLEIPGVTTRTCHQLGVELVDDFQAHERVIFIDAGRVTEPYEFRQLEGKDASNGGGSHFMSPAVLHELTKRLFSSIPAFYLCTVRGKDFNFGEEFSDSAIDAAKQAIRFIMDILTKENQYA